MSAIYKNGVQYVGITDAANMSVDVGQNTLNLKDTVQNVIENFADTETNPSSQAYSAGDFLTYNGILHKAIADIEVGDTLVVGTNIVATTFSAQLKNADSNSFIYAETIEQLYEQINVIPLHQVRLFEVHNDLASMLTNNEITTFYKGFVAKMDGYIFDFFGVDGSGFTFGQRIRFDSPSTFVIQRKDSYIRLEAAHFNNGNILCQNSKTSTSVEMQKRLITQNFNLVDNVTDYKTLQYIGSKDGFKLDAQRRSDDVWEHLWDTSLMPRLSGGQAIPANANLNDYINPGTYYCSATTSAKTVTNRPSGMDVAFVMYVRNATGTDYRHQSIYPYDSAKSYHRTRFSDGWGSWVTPTQNITGGASSIATTNLTTSRALISNSSGKVGVSDTTTTELGYVHGVTSTIQDQINSKAPKNHASTATTYGVATTASYGHVKYGTSSGTACQGNDTRLSNSRTPVAHASTATTYGAASSSSFGHVKLSDTYTSSVGGASAGIGASQSAVYNTYNSLLNTYMKYSSGTGTVNTTYVNTGENVVFDWQRIRIGNKAIVTLVFDFWWRSTYSTNNVAIAATKLPGAASGGYTFAAASAGTDSSNENKSFIITTDGVLKPWYCGNITGHCFGSVTYISSTVT